MCIYSNQPCNHPFPHSQIILAFAILKNLKVFANDFRDFRLDFEVDIAILVHSKRTCYSVKFLENSTPHHTRNIT